MYDTTNPISAWIRFDSIQIPLDRQRQEFDPMELLTLADSIESKGLMHPVVLREGDVLVAGERRLRAIQTLHQEGKSFT